MFQEAIDWVYRLGIGQLIGIGAFPAVIAILLVSIGSFIFIGMDDDPSKEEAKKVRGDMLKSAQLRVQAYRAGFEQREKQSVMSRGSSRGPSRGPSKMVNNSDYESARKRSASGSRGKGDSSVIINSGKKDQSRKVSFNIS
eukprot:GFUD01018178.1.p1 GENE.GFUD01018178.1~~GFUD01018178.1.p1  ORF type:complete len:141 (-),score=23.03 GFUD01018178.1:148-570(-)